MDSEVELKDLLQDWMWGLRASASGCLAGGWGVGRWRWRWGGGGGGIPRPSLAAAPLTAWPTGQSLGSGLRNPQPCFLILSGDTLGPAPMWEGCSRHRFLLSTQLSSQTCGDVGRGPPRRTDRNGREGTTWQRWCRHGLALSPAAGQETQDSCGGVVRHSLSEACASCGCCRQ